MTVGHVAVKSQAVRGVLGHGDNKSLVVGKANARGIVGRSVLVHEGNGVGTKGEGATTIQGGPGIREVIDPDVGAKVREAAATVQLKSLSSRHLWDRPGRFQTRAAR